MTINRLRADGSLQVLVFVCCPLVLLLGTLIGFLICGSRTIARFPTFSVKMEEVSREDTYVIYRDQKGCREFYMRPSGEKHAVLDFLTDLLHDSR